MLPKVCAHVCGATNTVAAYASKTRVQRTAGVSDRQLSILGVWRERLTHSPVARVCRATWSVATLMRVQLPPVRPGRRRALPARYAAHERQYALHPLARSFRV